ncbi:MAG: Maf family protein [Eubacteriales bacterium]|nr:Maf family protein [Eubacteriales bacterium]
MQPDIILASQSPRRQQLLSQMGLRFRVIASGADEDVYVPGDAAATVRALARLKGRAVAARYPAALVIAADTVVVYAGQILGKPADRRQAVQMLSRLSGSEHRVLTGVYVALDGRELCQHEETAVVFGQLTAQEIAAYVHAASPFDKAGAYGIQEQAAVFVQQLRGCYDNVMGLPLTRLYQMMCQILPGGQAQALGLMYSKRG